MITRIIILIIVFTIFIIYKPTTSLASSQKQQQHKIEHVVLLMLENRAFDHMCGFFPNVNGLKGVELFYNADI